MFLFSSELLSFPRTSPFLTSFSLSCSLSRAVLCQSSHSFSFSFSLCFGCSSCYLSATIAFNGSARTRIWQTVQLICMLWMRSKWVKQLQISLEFQHLNSGSEYICEQLFHSALLIHG